MSDLSKRLRAWANDPLIRGSLEADLLAAEALEAAEWRDISEAPRDGTVILLEHGGSVYPGRWHDDGTKWPWKVMDSDGEMNGIMHGSHGPRRFRQLPAPPAERGKG